jgi:hypothetical protein
MCKNNDKINQYLQNEVKIRTPPCSHEFVLRRDGMNIGVLIGLKLFIGLLISPWHSNLFQR